MGRKSRARTRTFYRERAEESKSIRYITRSVVQALEKGQDPAQKTPEVSKQAQRTARHAVKALDHPLHKRLKEDVDSGNVDLRRYGYVPKNPKPAWWVQKARKIYARETKTEIDMDVKAFGVDEESEHGPKEEKDPDIEIAQVFRAKEEYAMDIDGGNEIGAMKMEQSLSSAPSSLRNHTVPDALSPSNHRPPGLVNPWDVHGFQTLSETNSSPQSSDGRRAQRDPSPFIRPELDELSWEEQSEELLRRGRSGWPPFRMHLSKAPGWKQDNTSRNAQMMGKVGEALQRGGGLGASDGSLLGVQGACRVENNSRPFERIMNARFEQNTQTHVQIVKEKNRFGYIKETFNIENAKRVETKKENVTTDDGPTEEQEWRVYRKERESEEDTKVCSFGATRGSG